MDLEIVNPLLKVTAHVLETTSQTKPLPGTPVIKSGTRTFGVVTGMIGMAGNQLTGNLLISFDQPSILAIVSRMFMEKFEEINKDIVDAVGELTNMICGGAKRELSEGGYSFDMATPIVITGKDVDLRQMAESTIYTIPFSTPEGEFVVETNLAKRNAAR